MINFCSNDYLGLANDPGIKQAFIAAVEKYGAGAGASEYVCGFTDAHYALEETITDVTGYERSLYFASGYMANLAIQSCLLNKDDRVFLDRLTHASNIDAAVLSRAQLRRYPHQDTVALRQCLQEDGASRKMIVTDGVFSMDGDIASLQQLAGLANQYHSLLVVDDAHGFAVIGETGLGTPEYCAVQPHQIDVYMATLGKACGLYGAFVAGSRDIIEHLLQTARTLIYTTALPPAVASAARAGLEKACLESWRRDRLHSLISRFRNGAAELELPLLESVTPIQPFMVYENSVAVSISNALFDAGFLITAIRPPTVPKGTARLRITISATHTEDHIDRLLEALAGECRRNSA